MYLLYIDAISVTKERSTQNQGVDGEAQVGCGGAVPLAVHSPGPCTTAPRQTPFFCARRVVHACVAVLRVRALPGCCCCCCCCRRPALVLTRPLCCTGGRRGCGQVQPQQPALRPRACSRGG
jgi:hypothetical protein